MGSGVLRDRARRKFESARPRILGALLDAAVRGLQRLPTVRLTSLPRMADFALWATAYETALWPTGTFARAYDANRNAAAEDVIANDPVSLSPQPATMEDDPTENSQRTAGSSRISDLLSRVKHGEEILITKRNKPVAVLSPYRPHR